MFIIGKINNIGLYFFSNTERKLKKIYDNCKILHWASLLMTATVFAFALLFYSSLPYAVTDNSIFNGGIKQNTPLFHLLENIQNEVHRFAITFHRDKRSKNQVASVLDDIAGIGEKRKTALLKAFKSVSRIKKATLEEIAEVVGMSAAKNIKEKLKE